MNRQITKEDSGIAAAIARASPTLAVQSRFRLLVQEALEKHHGNDRRAAETLWRLIGGDESLLKESLRLNLVALAAQIAPPAHSSNAEGPPGSVDHCSPTEVMGQPPYAGNGQCRDAHPSVTLRGDGGHVPYDGNVQMLIAPIRRDPKPSLRTSKVIAASNDALEKRLLWQLKTIDGKPYALVPWHECVVRAREGTFFAIVHRDYKPKNQSIRLGELLPDKSARKIYQEAKNALS